jgi:hypothetical protein
MDMLTIFIFVLAALVAAAAAFYVMTPERHQ